MITGARTAQKDVSADDPQVREAGHPRRVDVELVAYAQGHGPDEAIVGGRHDDAEDRHGRRQIRSGQRVERDEQDDAGQRHDRVGDEAGDGLEGAAVEARDQARRHAEQDGH
ncbi:MAG: hypothetical protein QM713_08520 [Arachnia sp.]